MPKMKVNIGTPTTPNWVVMDAKDADTVDGLHASSFAMSGHNHDSTYSVISHNHDGSYYTESEIGSTTSGSSGAKKVGVTTISGLTGNDVQTCLANLFQFANDGKTAVANAITAKGVSASSSDTFSTLATKVGQIPKAQGNAVENRVLNGTTFTNADGVLRTGSMTDNGAMVITPSTYNQTIPWGFHGGGGYVVGDEDFVAPNIKSGVNIFGLVGTGPKYAVNDYVKAEKVVLGDNTIPKPKPLWGAVYVTDAVYLMEQYGEYLYYGRSGNNLSMLNKRTGVFINSINPDVNGVRGLVVDQVAGYLYLLTDNYLYKLNADLSTVWKVTLPNYGSTLDKITQDANYIYYLNGTNIRFHRKSDGLYISQYTPTIIGDMNSIFEIKYYKGNLWIACDGSSPSRQIRKLDSGGYTAQSFNSTDEIDSFDFDSLGNIWGINQISTSKPVRHFNGVTGASLGTTGDANSAYLRYVKCIDGGVYVMYFYGTLKKFTEDGAKVYEVSQTTVSSSAYGQKICPVEVDGRMMVAYASNYIDLLDPHLKITG